MESRNYGRLAAFACGGFLALLGVLHMVEWPKWPRHVSLYGISDSAMLWDGALTLLALGILCLAWSLQGPRVTGVTAARILLAVTALCTFLLVVFPTDRQLNEGVPTTTTGFLHDTMAVTGVALTVAAMYMLAGAGRLHPTWQRIAGSSFALPHLAMGLGLLWMALDRAQLGLWGGLVQRALTILSAVWLLTTSLKVAQIDWSAPEASPSGRPE